MTCSKTNGPTKLKGHSDAESVNLR